MDAPITWLGEVRGVLGVCSRDDGALRLDRSRAPGHVRAARLARAPQRRELRGRASARRRCSAASTGSPRCSARRSRSRETLDALAQAACDALGGCGCLRARAGRRRRSPSPAPTSCRQTLAEPLAARPAGRGRSARSRPHVRSGSSPSTSLADDDRFDEALRKLLGKTGYRSLLCAPVAGARGRERRRRRPLRRRAHLLGRRSRRSPATSPGAARGALERSELFESGAPGARVLAAARGRQRPARHEARPGARARRGRRARRPSCSSADAAAPSASSSTTSSSSGPPAGAGSQEPRRAGARARRRRGGCGGAVALAARGRGRARDTAFRPRGFASREQDGQRRVGADVRARRHPARCLDRLRSRGRASGARTRCRPSSRSPPRRPRPSRVPTSISASRRRRNEARRSSRNIADGIVGDRSRGLHRPLERDGGAHHRRSRGRGARPPGGGGTPARARHERSGRARASARSRSSAAARTCGSR